MLVEDSHRINFIIFRGVISLLLTARKTKTQNLKMILTSFFATATDNHIPDMDAIWLTALFVGERLERGHTSAADAAADIIQATKTARDATRQAPAGREATT